MDMKQIDYQETRRHMIDWMKSLARYTDALVHVARIQNASSNEELDRLKAEYLLFMKKYTKPRVLASFMPKDGTLEGLTNWIIENVGGGMKKRFQINWALVASGIPCRTGTDIIMAYNKREARKFFKADKSLFETATNKYKIVSVI